MQTLPKSCSTTVQQLHALTVVLPATSSTHYSRLRNHPSNIIWTCQWKCCKGVWMAVLDAMRRQSGGDRATFGRRCIWPFRALFIHLTLNNIFQCWFEFESMNDLFVIVEGLESFKMVPFDRLMGGYKHYRWPALCSSGRLLAVC